ncbi:MAG: hypothetical protein OCD76_02885 [Reichenbachiella sp.]
MGENINYPSFARNNNIYGTLLVHFFISSEGKMTKLTFLNNLGGGIEEDLIDLFTKKLPNWLPQKNDSSYIMPIRYSIDKDYEKYIPLSKISPRCLDMMVVTGYNANSSTTIQYAFDYKSYKKKYAKAMKKNKYEKGLQFLTKLMLIDPFVESYYKDRISIENNLGQNIFTKFDTIILEELF